jgi:hypothetical protein
MVLFTLTKIECSSTCSRESKSNQKSKKTGSFGASRTEGCPSKPKHPLAPSLTKLAGRCVLLLVCAGTSMVKVSQPEDNASEEAQLTF